MRKIIAAMALATVAAVVVAAIAVASGEGPTSTHNDGLVRVDGNPTCPASSVASFKVDPVGNGTFGPGGLVTISNYNGKTLDWALTPLGRASYEIAIVIVKGGPNANVYTYSHILDNSDQGLHPPLNPNGNTMGGTKVYGFSHVDFCFDPKIVGH